MVEFIEYSIKDVDFFYNKNLLRTSGKREKKEEGYLLVGINIIIVIIFFF